MKNLGERSYRIGAAPQLTPYVEMNHVYGWSFDMPNLAADRVLVCSMYFKHGRPNSAGLSMVSVEDLFVCRDKHELLETLMLAVMRQPTALSWYTAYTVECLPSA